MDLVQVRNALLLWQGLAGLRQRQELLQQQRGPLPPPPPLPPQANNRPSPAAERQQSEVQPLGVAAGYVAEGAWRGDTGPAPGLGLGLGLGLDHGCMDMGQLQRLVLALGAVAE